MIMSERDARGPEEHEKTRHFSAVLLRARSGAPGGEFTSRETPPGRRFPLRSSVAACHPRGRGEDMHKSPVTIHDVARAAGVSVGTVSKALNGYGQLREETRTAVRSAADRLGFRPNDLAQSLLRKRSFTVGLISTDSYGRFSIPVLEGIESALEPARISVFLCSAADDPAREQQHIDSLMAKRVDGIIVTGRRTDKRP